MTDRLGRQVAFFCGLPIAFVLLVFALALCGAAKGHDWYTGLKHPLTDSSCCGIDDCAPFPDELVRAGEGGYTVSPPGREAEFVPYSEVVDSPDGQFHRCARLYGEMKGELLCFIAPGMGF